MGQIIEHTRSRQGKVRPWILVSAPFMAITGVLLFAIPKMSLTGQAIWVMVSFNLFYSFAFTIYNMSHYLMVPLSTRKSKQRDQLSVFTNIASIMISGMVVALIFPMVIMPMIGVDQSKWILVMGVVSALVLPLTIIEYFFTKERITEENINTGNEKTIPIKQQLKAAFTNKYWLLIVAYMLIFTFGQVIKNSSLPYFCNWVLGSYNDGITQTLVSAIGGLPMGIGLFLIWPLCKKYGKRYITLIGFVMSFTGSIVCLLGPKSMVIILIGQFIKNFGLIPSAYVFPAILADVLEHAEWKNDFRIDGLTSSVINVITTICAGVGLAALNGLLSATGYIAPVTSAAGELVTVTQGAATQTAITIGFVGMDILTNALLVAILIFLNIEKKMPQISAEIQARHTGKS
jgi:GPH family glycoside/pentoside/hexuronide:cation symporter